MVIWVIRVIRVHRVIRNKRVIGVMLGFRVILVCKVSRVLNVIRYNQSRGDPHEIMRERV